MLFGMVAAMLMLSSIFAVAAGDAHQFVLEVSRSSDDRVMLSELSSGVPQSKKPLKTSPKPIKILVSIKPLAFWLNSLVPEDFGWEIAQLGVADSDPHHYSLKPSDIIKLQDADLFVWLGPAAEPQYSELLGRMKGIQWAVLDASKPLYRRQLNQAKGDESIFSYTDQVDPHIWVSLSQLPAIWDALANQLAAFSGDHHALLMDRLALMKREIIRVKKWLESELGGAGAKLPILSHHDELQYLEENLGLISHGFLQLYTHMPLSVNRMLYLKKRVDKQGVACAFIQPDVSRAVIEDIFGSQIKLVSLDLRGTHLPGDASIGEYWKYVGGRLIDCYN